MQFIEEEKEAEHDIQDPSVCVNPLTVDKRRELVRHLVDFMVKSFGLFPSAYQKRSTANAAIILFPRLACEKSSIGGIVSTSELIISNKLNIQLHYGIVNTFIRICC